MGKIKYMMLAAGTFLAVGFASAQQAQPQRMSAFGYVPRAYEMWSTRLHDLSTHNFNLGTARSAAMGGAFTSLGADLSAMHINPAGLGMYRRSEFGITMGPSITETTNSMRGYGKTTDSRTAFGVNSLGAVFNLYESSRAVTSFSFGLGYTRLADYNYRSTVNINGAPQSMLDMFARQAAGYGDIKVGDSKPFDFPEYGGAYNDEWGAVLAVNTSLLALNGEGGYYAPGIADGTDIAKRLRTISKGSAGEYAFSGGWNFGNTVYFGLTVGVVDLYQDREITYSEDYSGDRTEDPAEYMKYRQSVKSEGGGVNVKMGLIYRPTPEVRMGLAFHSPTFMTVKNYYNTRMDSKFINADKDGANSYMTTPDEIIFTDRFMTPARLMAGLSYTVANRAILSVDYEAAFYQGIRMFGDTYDGIMDNGLTLDEQYTDMIKDRFRTSNTLRVGTEVLATDMLAIRFGYVLSEQGLKNKFYDGTYKNDLADLPLQYRSEMFSAGIGLNLSRDTSLDMTYSYARSKYTDYDLFYASPENGVEYYAGNSPLDRTRLAQKRHNVMLSLSYKF